MSEIAEKMADELASKLIEHCDSVRIFITNHDGGHDQSGAYSVGRGNFYAQLGQVKDWVVRQDTLTKVEAKDSTKGDE